MFHSIDFDSGVENKIISGIPKALFLQLEQNDDLKSFIQNSGYEKNKKRRSRSGYF